MRELSPQAVKAIKTAVSEQAEMDAEMEDDLPRVITSLKTPTALYLHGVDVVVTVEGIVEAGMSVQYTLGGEVRSARLGRKIGFAGSFDCAKLYGSDCIEMWTIQ